MRGAIRNAGRVEALDVRTATHGIAFAYAMLNSADLPRVLETGADLRHPEIAEGFESGLAYALAFWDWPFPGVLDTLAPRTDRQAQLVTRARSVIEESRRANRLTPFAVDPRIANAQ